MVPHLTRFEPLRVMAIFGTYLRAGRGSEPVWFRGSTTLPKVPVIYGAKTDDDSKKILPPPPLRPPTIHVYRKDIKPKISLFYQNLTQRETQN